MKLEELTESNLNQAIDKAIANGAFIRYLVLFYNEREQRRLPNWVWAQSIMVEASRYVQEGYVYLIDVNFHLKEKDILK